MFDMIPFAGRNHNWLDPFDEFERNMFGGLRHSFADFRTDVLDQNDRYVVEAELPGFEKKDIRAEVKNGFLTISAEHKEEDEKKDEKGNYLRRERRYGSFRRSFDLSGVDEDRITASYKNGILTLELPKKEAGEKSDSRQIDIS